MASSVERVLAGFDEYAARQMEVWPGPGLAVGILYHGEVAYRCFGVRDVETGEAVDPDSLFSIGSCTKAFTTMALGLLIEEGALAWDVPIHRYLPDFELWDRVATEQMTLRDLACHRSGLPRHDLMWYGSHGTRQELYHRLRYLQPSQPFRYTFGYQNLMYMTAGLLIEAVTGQTWEDFIAGRILRPLGMHSSTTDIAAVKAAPNSARPHGGDAADIHKIPYFTLDAVGPAGAVYSNLTDMAIWMALHMCGGTHDGKQFIDAALLKEMHRPQIVMPPVPEMVWRDYAEIPLNTSGLGWAGLIYRGYPVVRHMGGIDGFISQVAFVPGEDVGLIVFSNMNGTLLPVVLTFDLLDRLLGLAPIDWSGRLRAFEAGAEEQIAAARQAQADQRQANRRPTHPLGDYVGDYAHPAYGTLRVRCEEPNLVATRDALEFTLTHYHYDTFELAFRDAPVPLLATFSLNAKGAVDGVRVPFEPAVEPITFKRCD